MALNETIKTNFTNSAAKDESSLYKKKSLNLFINSEQSLYSVKEHSANSVEDESYKKEVSTSSTFNSRGKNMLKEIQLQKRKVLNMLNNENISVGYTSMTELYLDKLINYDVFLVKEIINLIYVEYFDNPVILQKIIEVMSNLDYETLYPTNITIAVGCVNHLDINIQEAAIAAYEKWDDKKNTLILKNINYTADWIKDYADAVIDYLESC